MAERLHLWLIHFYPLTPPHDNQDMTFPDDSGLYWTGSTAHGQCSAWRKRWDLTESEVCACSSVQTVSHNNNETDWLMSYGKWSIQQQQQQLNSDEDSRQQTESMRMPASGVARSLRYRLKSMRTVYVTPRSRHELGLTMKWRAPDTDAAKPRYIISITIHL